MCQDPTAVEEALELPDEEVSRCRAIPTPKTPSQAELDLHRITHMPYRCWCPECVEGFGREWSHQETGTERLIPLLSCDYLYMTEKGIFKRDELSEDERMAALRIFVAICGATKSIFAHAVPRKGVDPEGYIVEKVKQDILWLGHAKIMIRSDNEPALAQVVAHALVAAKVSGVETATSEGSVPYDPQTNGAAESAGGLIKKMMRTHILSLERQIQARVPLDHPVLAWLVSHCAFLRTLQVRGSDGLTPYQRARGTAGPQKLATFGETVRYKARSKEEGGIAHTGWRWSVGVWLGVERHTGQYILYDKAMGGFATRAH